MLASRLSTSSRAASVAAGRRACKTSAVRRPFVFSASAEPAESSAKDEGQTVIERALNEYTDLETKGKLTSHKTFEDFRNKFGIKRNLDGRVSLQNSKGEWFSVRLDMEVPGSMLLRSSKGQIYAVQTETLQQIDLSDDLVVLMLFSDRDWEGQMVPVQYGDEQGRPKTLELDEKEFREVIGILKETEMEGEGEDEGEDNQGPQARR